ncbi:MAG: hypothetical protein ABFS38_04580 [Bacteroidota bacterium]
MDLLQLENPSGLSSEGFSYVDYTIEISNLNVVGDISRIMELLPDNNATDGN